MGGGSAGFTRHRDRRTASPSFRTTCAKALAGKNKPASTAEEARPLAHVGDSAGAPKGSVPRKACGGVR